MFSFVNPLPTSILKRIVSITFNYFCTYNYKVRKTLFLSHFIKRSHIILLFIGPYYHVIVTFNQYKKS